MRLPGKSKALSFVVIGLDVLLFLVSVEPNFYSLLWENPWLAENAEHSDFAVSILFDGGSLVYSYAVLSAMIQKYSTKYLTEFGQLRFRRVVLYITAYLAGLSVLINAHGLTGFFPKDMPIPPSNSGAEKLLMLISSAAALVLSVKYYKFLGRRRGAV